MADDLVGNAGVGGATFAFDDISSVFYPRSKISLGADGSATDAVGGTGTVSAAVQRVTIATDDAVATQLAKLGGTVSTANSTTANLAGAAVFTGTSEDVSNYAAIQVSVFSSHASATDGLSIQQSSNGTNWDITDVYTIAATTGKTFSFQPCAQFYRLVYTNGGTLTTSLRIQTVFHYSMVKSSSQRPSDATSNENDFEQISGFMHLYNGTTWDRVRGDTTNGVDVDVTRVPTDPFGANADAASSTGSISAKLRFIAATGIPITGTVTVGSHAVTNAGTFAVQPAGSVAHDGVATAVNPVLNGAYASAAAPADVSADGDSVRVWALRSGAQVVQPTFAGVLGVAGNGASGTGVQRVTLANDSTGVLATVSTVTTVSTLTGGGVAHDSADSGNPIKTGAKAIASLAGTTIVTAADRADNQADLDGALLIRESFPLGDLLSERVSNTDGASTALTVFGATASSKNYITGYSMFRTDAGTTPIYVDIRDGTAGAILWSVVLPPNGGANMASSVPLFKNATANTALAIDVSAATTTVYISLSGFKSKVG